jgi:hypothetical protein
MPNFAEPVTTTFIAVSIAVIFAVVGLGIVLVKVWKKSKKLEG